MITEDYVSFDIAKLLKEKGFDENCAELYHLRTGEIIQQGVGYVFHNSQWENFVSAPTLQMAMKWLREVHSIDISIAVRFWNKDEDALVKSWKYTVYCTDEIENFGQSNTYEEACEAAIKYCLENLI